MRDASSDERNTPKDVIYSKRVFKWLTDRTFVDRNAVLVHGYSNGAFMTYKLACEASELISAVGIIGGALHKDITCKPKRPLTLIHFHGKADDCVNYNFAKRTMNNYAKVAGCTDKSHVTTTMSDKVYCYGYNECQKRTTVRLCHYEDVRHSWPGSGKYCPRTQCQNDAGCWGFVTPQTPDCSTVPKSQRETKYNDGACVIPLEKPDDTIDATTYLWSVYMKRSMSSLMEVGLVNTSAGMAGGNITTLNDDFEDIEGEEILESEYCPLEDGTATERAHPTVPVELRVE